jgi:hypothetical protein
VKEKVTGELRKLQNEELHDLCCSPNIIRLMKSKTVGQACGTQDVKEKFLQGFGAEMWRRT